LRLLGVMADLCHHPRGKKSFDHGEEVSVSHFGRPGLMAVATEVGFVRVLGILRFREPLDIWKGLSHEPRGDPPGQRVDLDLCHGEPFTLSNHGVQTGVLLGAFLSVVAVAAILGCPARARADHFVV
jgi:hypothetical protein